MRKAKEAGNMGRECETEVEKETEAHVPCLLSHYVQECTSYLCEKVLGCQRKNLTPRENPS